ncbi:MAG: GNAT family N-acetyltransferase [candidate division Zixibacteria bacterium]|nr:GNAT family N-acetyltransferase [candidate division Zixibacteria bacterium]
MVKFSDTEEGNLIHLSNPGLIPSNLVKSFYETVESGFGSAGLKEDLLNEFERDSQEYPAYLWESNGEPLSFYIYRYNNKKAEILWCHQIKALFPVEKFLRPAIEQLIIAFLDDLGAEKIYSFFSFKSSIIGIDLLSMILPELEFKKFGVEIMETAIDIDEQFELPHLPTGFRCTAWKVEKTNEAAELMARVGDDFINYVQLDQNECRDFINEVFDPGMSRLVTNQQGEIVAFINFDRKGWIGQVFTDREYQGKGIGKYLLMYALKSLSEKNTKKSSLGVLSSNKRAIKLYREFGFESRTVKPIWAWIVPPGFELY